MYVCRLNFNKLYRLTFILFYLLNFSFVVFSQENSELHLNLGLNYPSIGFVDSQGNQSLISDFTNISSNHIKLGYKQKIDEDLGILFSLASNKYDVLARYGSSDAMNFVKYNLDYFTGALAFTLDFELSNDFNFVPNIGLNYNYLISGFQHMGAHLYDLKEDKDFVPYSISLNPGFYFSKRLTPVFNFTIGYNYVYDIESNERTTTQSYDLKSHTFFVGTSFSIGSMQNEIDIQKEFDDKLINLEISYSNINEKVGDVKSYIDSIFISGTNSNSSLQSEIENYFLTLNLLQNPIIADFVVFFPSNEAKYSSLFDDVMIDLLAVALDSSTSILKLVGYADLNGGDLFNLTLSKKRTETIQNYLINNGVNPNKIKIDFLGETSIFDSNNLMSNRRVEIFISKN